MPMYCVTKKCSQCGSQRVEKISVPDKVIPVDRRIQEKISELKERAQKEQKQLDVVITYEGEASIHYMLGASAHEGCGGQWKEVSRKNLDEVKEDLTRLRNKGVDLTDAMNRVRQSSIDNED